MPKYGVQKLKMRLTFRKFHKTILAFKMPKCDVFITNIGVLNAPKKAFKMPKKEAF